MDVHIPQHILAFLWLLEETAIENEMHPEHKFSFHQVLSEGIETFFHPEEGPLDIRVFWDVNMFVNYFTPRSLLTFHFIRGLTPEVVREAGFPMITGDSYPEINEQVISGYAIYSSTIPGEVLPLFDKYPERMAEAFARVNYRNQTLPPIEEFELRDLPETNVRISLFNALAWNSTFLSYLLVSQSIPDLRAWRLNENQNTFLSVLVENDDTVWLAKYEAFWNRWSELHDRVFRVSTLRGIVRQDPEVNLPDGRVLHPGRYKVKEYHPPRVTYAALALDLPLLILESLMFVGAFDI